MWSKQLAAVKLEEREKHNIDAQTHIISIDSKIIRFELPKREMAVRDEYKT